MKLKYINLDTGRDNIIYLHQDSDVVKKEGFLPLHRVAISGDNKTIYATLNIIENDNFIKKNEVGASKKVFEKFGSKDNVNVEIKHLGALPSFKNVIAKLDGVEFTEQGLYDVIKDIVDGKYSDMHIATFCGATAGDQ